MQTDCRSSRISSSNVHRLSAATAIAMLALTGCTIVGPAAIYNGRLAYNEAIVATDNQQMLMVVVHNRYNESANLLTVASVTANVHTTTSAGVQVGYGSDSNYSGNLVPFTAGTIYEENPTISYVPVGGSRYLRRLMAPVPIATIAQMTSRITNPAGVYWTLVTSANGIRNPDFATVLPDPRFERFVTLMAKLTDAGCLIWVANDAKENDFSIVLSGYADQHLEDVRDLLTLLGIDRPSDDGAEVVLPVSLAAVGRVHDGITITTRSVFDLMEILSASVELPDADTRSGAALHYPPSGPVGRSLKIASSKGTPEQAYVAVRHRDVWFYIDERDQPTKQFFRLLSTLWSVTMAESTRNSATPVLTVPVSR